MSDFRVVVLGSGAAVPTPERGTTSVCVLFRQHTFLVDAGEGVQLALRKARVRFHGISGVFITHLHGDHVLGLPGLLSSLSLLGRTRALHVWGPAGLEAWVQATVATTRTHLGYPVEFQVWPEEAGVCWESEDFRISAFPVRHRIPCWGIRFDERPRPQRLRKEVVRSGALSVEAMRALKSGETVLDSEGRTVRPEEALLPPEVPRSFVYASDTLPCDAVKEHGRGAGLLFHDATFADTLRKRAKETGHSTARQAAEVAAEAQVRSLLLGHISARYPGRADVLVEEACSVFPECTVACDGMMWEVPRGHSVDKF